MGKRFLRSTFKKYENFSSLKSTKDKCFECNLRHSGRVDVSLKIRQYIKGKL